MALFAGNGLHSVPSRRARPASAIKAGTNDEATVDILVWMDSHMSNICEKCGADGIKQTWDTAHPSVAPSRTAPFRAAQNITHGHPILGALGLGAVAATLIFATPYKCSGCGHEWRSWSGAKAK